MECNQHSVAQASPHDVKGSTMYESWKEIARIAQDPDFHITTALLWIRSSTSQRSSPGQSASEAETKLPAIVLNDAIKGPSIADLGTEIREDKPDLGLLHLHRDRLAAAAEALGWRSLNTLEHNDSSLKLLRREIERHLEQFSPLPPSTVESRKIRILIDKDGKISIDSGVIDLYTPIYKHSLLSTPFVPDSFDQGALKDTALTASKIFLDRQPTRPSTLLTHKTTHRCSYISARERLGIASNTLPTAEEVLLYNPYGEITETSSCTIYFKRDGTWITPAAICGPNLGVTRRLAIEKGLCKQGTIELGELQANEMVWLSNAVRGFFRGILCTDAKGLSNSAESQEIAR